MKKTKFSVKSSDPCLYEFLKQNAIRMRNNPTQTDSIAWNLLANKNFNAKFRRQHIIGEYILDFVNLETGLIIEIDGGYHNDPEQISQDNLRTQFLNKLGYTVLRFKNEEIICDTD